jgi:hypothetical protein
MSAEFSRPPEFSRPIAADRIGAGDFSTVVEATADERAAVAERLMIPAVAALSCTVTLCRGADAARGEIVAEGELRAAVTRTCVVSAEDFAVEITTRFRALLVRAGTERDEIDLEGEDEVAYQDGVLDLGELATEELALALDPYPRMPGAVSPDDAGEREASPFAILASRKRSH